MRIIIILLPFFVYSLNSFCQIVVTNSKNETVSNVEFLNQKGGLVCVSDNGGIIPYLTEDSVYKIFHPNYEIEVLKYGGEDTIFLGNQIYLFETVDVFEKDIDLYKRIYDSTYLNFVNQEVYLIGELWIYQKTTSTLNDSSKVLINKYKLDVAYMKNPKKKKKEYWAVKGMPYRNYIIQNEYLDSVSYKSKKDRVQKALTPPNVLTSFFRRKKWLSSTDEYSDQRSFFEEMTNIELSNINKHGVTNSHKITYHSVNYRCDNYIKNNFTGENGFSMMGNTVYKPIDLYSCNFVLKNGYYYPELMVFNYKYNLVNTDLGSSNETELIYLFKVNGVSEKLENSNDYIEQDFTNDNFLQNIVPNKKDLVFPFFLN